MKRARSEQSAPTAPPASTATEEAHADLNNDHLLSGLATWCDTQLRAAATLHRDSVPSLECANHELDRLGDDSFVDFLESLEQDQRISVDELKKGHVAESWRRAVADVARLYAFMAQMTESSFSYRFYCFGFAREAFKSMAESSESAMDEWQFNLAYELATQILSTGATQVSDDDADSDEPVDETSTEEEESDTESGSSSESDSD
jgi:hypothetical protein